MTISIPNWDSRFETAQSRRCEVTSWIPMRRSFAVSLKLQKPQVAVAMVQILFLASSMPKRGVLNDGGNDLSIDDISSYVGAPSSVIARALSALGVGSETREGEREREKERDVKSAPCLEMVTAWNEIAERLGLPGATEPTGKENKKNLTEFWEECGKDRSRWLAAFQYGAKRYSTLPGSKPGLWSLVRPSNRGQYIDAAPANGPANGAVVTDTPGTFVAIDQVRAALKALPLSEPERLALERHPKRQKVVDYAAEADRGNKDALNALKAVAGKAGLNGT